MTFYEAIDYKHMGCDLVLKNGKGVLIKSLGTLKGADFCQKVAAILNALPKIIEALEAIEATKVHKIPGSYDDNRVWLVSAGAIRKAEKALAKLRETL